MNWFTKKGKNSPELAPTNIPKTANDARLEDKVDRMWEAHDHFTKILKEFTEDVKRDNLQRRKTDV